MNPRDDLSVYGFRTRINSLLISVLFVSSLALAVSGSAPAQVTESVPVEGSEDQEHADAGPAAGQHPRQPRLLACAERAAEQAVKPRDRLGQNRSLASSPG